MPGLFVTATGTDVGKTFVTCGLLEAGRRAGVTMDALKPVLSGFAWAEAAKSDAGLLLAALGREVTDAAIAALSPWRFAAPLSPDMAAAAEGRAIIFDDIVAACRAALRPDRLTFIEGVGGVMVPLDDHRTILDLVVALKIPVVLVSATGLGAISHGLTAVAALRERAIVPVAMVLNESAASTVPLAATHATIAAFCPNIPVTIVPRDAGPPVFDALLHRLSPLGG